MKLAYKFLLTSSTIATLTLASGCESGGNDSPPATPAPPIDAAQPPVVDAPTTIDAPPMADALPTADARPLCYAGGGTPSAGVTIELGTGNGRFEALPENEEIVLVEGLQGGFHFVVHARMQGLAPGDRNLPAESNPATHFRAFNEAGDEMTALECTYPNAYVENGNGYELSYGALLIISRQYGDIYGQRVRLTVEAIDTEGQYAIDERWLTVIASADVDASLP